MIEQHDVDQLLARLKAVREQLFRDREAARAELSNLLAHAETMRRDAQGGRFEACIVSVHELLSCLQRGMDTRLKRDHLAA